MQMNGKASYMSPEEGATQVQFAGGAGSGRRGSRWSRLEMLLAALCVLLATIALVLVVVVAAQNIYKDKDTTGHRKQHGTDYRYTVWPAHVCLTKGCVQAASRLLSAMDSTIDPCEDFFEFACGSWNKINIIPDDRADYNTFTKLGDDVQGMLKDLLEEPVTGKDSQATTKAKNLYASCLNETLIDLQGLEPIKKLVEELGGWPVVEGAAWRDDDVNLMDLIIKLRHYNNKILIEQWVSADDKNSEVNIIQLDQPDLGMPSPDYYLKSEDASFLKVYEKYARDVAILFGADQDTARRQIQDLVELEVKLANITIPLEERRDNEKIYNRMTVKKLQEYIPGFDWLRYLQKLFAPVNIEIKETEEVVVYAPTYLKDMVDIYHSTDKRTLVNYLIWRIMMNRVINLPRKYRVIKKDYYKTVFGSESERSRWRECVSYVNDNMGNAVGRLFVEKHFDETSKSTALEMIHNIREAFYELIEEADWMDEPTRIVAREKAEAVVEDIGYPDSILDDTTLNEEYADVTYSRVRYFENVLANLRHITIANFKQLREPVDRTKWSTFPAVVNAFYSSTKNQIMFPAAILQPPFYSKDYPKSLNYGGIGMVIGHEITHGFDDKGRQFDKDGNLIQWWDDHVIKRFKERAQCIIDQYSNYTVKEVNAQVNGIQTQGENIADNGGIKEAYRAYRRWVQDRGEEEPRLPGMLSYTHDQLFFINFAQVWCGAMRPEAAINRIRTSVHSPGRYRVIGTLQNMRSFSEAFQCSEHSYMNPSKKCSVW
ncbi:neprilysin-1-like [Babylonia areolata]|uniref:neprilysin-1-like n=1 Tax=Babylonia areolata TaxID=304850 RepID=UPI003FD1791D